MKTALAVERFKLKYGHLPDVLQELVPEYLEEVPIDPFYYKSLFTGFLAESNKGDRDKIKFLKKSPSESDSGYLLYGVGYDRTDNKGHFDAEKPFIKGNDIILSIGKTLTEH